MADSIASMSGSNKISTPILNTNQNSQQQTQRYVPSRLLNQQQQNQAQTDQTDSFNIPTSKIPISPKSTLNNGQNQPNSYRQVRKKNLKIRKKKKLSYEIFFY